MSLKPTFLGVTDNTIVLLKSLHILEKKKQQRLNMIYGITTLEVTIESHFLINKS